MIAPRATGHVRTGRISTAARPHAHVLGDAHVANLPLQHVLPPRKRDQGFAQTCTGFAYYAGPVMTWAKARGIAAAEISELAGYTGGRQWGGDPDAPLVDSGADPSRVMDFALAFGLLPETLRPYADDPAVVNRRLTPYELEVAALFRVKDFAHIDAVGPGLVDVAVQALAQDIPVPFGQEVYPSYMSLRGPALYAGPRQGEQSEGRHAQYTRGFRWNAARNAWDLLVQGSWADFGDDDGSVWITSEFFASAFCFDQALLRYTQVIAP